MKFSDQYGSPGDIPKVIPVFPLSGALLLPRGQLPLNIFEPRYLAMVDDAMRGNRLIGMIQPKTKDANDGVPELENTGTLGRITTWAETGDDRLLVTLAGITRFHVVEEVPGNNPYRSIKASYEAFADDFLLESDSGPVNRDQLIATLKDFVDAQDLSVDWEDIMDASDEALVNGLSMLSPYGPEEKQALLEVHDVGARAELLIALTELFLHRECEDMPGQLQ